LTLPAIFQAGVKEKSMSLEFDIACLRCPIDPSDTIGVIQLISRAKMAADQIEELGAQRDDLLAALEDIASMNPPTKDGEASCFYLARNRAKMTRASTGGLVCAPKS
jgi:hypothetical protein